MVGGVVESPTMRFPAGEDVGVVEVGDGTVEVACGEWCWGEGEAGGDGCAKSGVCME